MTRTFYNNQLGEPSPDGRPLLTAQHTAKVLPFQQPPTAADVIYAGASWPAVIVAFALIVAVLMWSAFLLEPAIGPVGLR